MIILAWLFWGYIILSYIICFIVVILFIANDLKVIGGIRNLDKVHSRRWLIQWGMFCFSPIILIIAGILGILFYNQRSPRGDA